MTLGTVPSSDVDEAMKGKKNRNQQSLRPWHRRPWFWIILAIILAVLAVGATNAAVFLTRKDPSTTGTLKVGADGTTLCVLDANNPSVGVGTCSPDRTVTVKGGASVLAGLPTEDPNVGFSFSLNGMSFPTGVFSTLVNNNTAVGDISMHVNGTDLMRIVLNNSPSPSDWHTVVNGSLFAVGDTLTLGRANPSLVDGISAGVDNLYGSLRAMRVVSFSDSETAADHASSGEHSPQPALRHVEGLHVSTSQGGLQDDNAMFAKEPAQKNSHTAATMSASPAVNTLALHLNFNNDYGGGIRVGRKDMVVDGTRGGRVGVGKLAPASRLDVAGGVRAIFGVPDSTDLFPDSGLQLGPLGTGVYSLDGSSVDIHRDGGQLVSFSAFTMTLEAETLLVGSAARNVLQVSGSSLFLGREATLSDLTLGVDRLHINSDGVGIGTLSPAFTLDVSGGVGAARGHPIQHSPVSQQGFAFTGSPSTGLFIAPDGESVSLFLEGVEYQRLADSSAFMTRNVYLSPGESATDSPSLALHSSLNGTLWVNPELEFHKGVLVGKGKPGGQSVVEAEATLHVQGSIYANTGYPEDSASLGIESGYSFTGVPKSGLFHSFINDTSPEIGLFIEGSRQMWVNRKGAFFINNQTSVSGSIRVLDGYPPGPDDLFNAGFAYGDDGDTGFFLRDELDASGDKDLGHFIDGLLVFQIRKDGEAQVTNGLSVLAGPIVLHDLTAITGTSTSLAVNPGDARDRVVLGDNHVLVEASSATTSGTSVVVGPGSPPTLTFSGTFRSGGSVRAAAGDPSTLGNSAADVGFAFDTTGHTGVFATNLENPLEEVQLMVQGVSRVRVPSAGNNIAMTDSLHVQGTEIMLGGGAERVAMRMIVPSGSPASDTMLVLNPVHDFVHGIRVGDANGLSVLQGQASIGGATLAGTFRSAGSVRASVGDPGLAAASDVGFAFDEFGNSGLFHTDSGTPVPAMNHRLEGVLRLHVPLTGPLEMSDSLLLSGDSLFLGDLQHAALFFDAGPDTLTLNQQHSYTGGIFFGRDSVHLIESSTTQVELQVGLTGSGRLFVHGPVRSRPGLHPTGGPTGALESGFTFLDTSSGTGFFVNDTYTPSTWNELLLAVEGDPLLRLHREGMASASTATLHTDLYVMGRQHISADLSIAGDRLYLGGEDGPFNANLLALQRQDEGTPSEPLLTINPTWSFSSGVRIGGLAGLRVGGSSGQPQVTVGNVPLSGTFRSSGSVRAAEGLPPSSGSADLGFAFGDEGTTGLFKDAGDSTVVLSIFGEPRVLVPATPAPVQVTSELEIHGGAIYFSESQNLQALSLSPSDPSTLEVDGKGDFSVLRLFNGTLTLRRPSNPPGFLGTQMTLGDSSPSLAPSGAFRVDGSIRAKSGTPTDFDALSPVLKTGFAFDDAASSGLFRKVGDFETVELWTGGMSRLVLPDAAEYQRRTVTAFLNATLLGQGDLFLRGSALHLGLTDAERPGSHGSGPALKFDSQSSSLFLNWQGSLASTTVLGNASVVLQEAHGTSGGVLRVTVGAGAHVGDFMLNVAPMVTGPVRGEIGPASADVSLTIGAVPVFGTLRVAGSVRAAGGAPGPTPQDSNVGFSFDEELGAGLFWNAAPGSTAVELYFGGDPLLRLRATPLSAILQGQGSSALIVECSQDVHVLGSEIRVGSQRGLALQSQGSVLRLNAGDMDPEDGHFGGGLSVGWLNDVVIRHDSMLDRTRVTMGQQMVAGKSTLVVAGGIRAAHGLPSPVDPEPDVGLSFLDDGSSGVFMSALDAQEPNARQLGILVDSVPMFLVSRSEQDDWHTVLAGSLGMSIRQPGSSGSSPSASGVSFTVGNTSLTHSGTFRSAGSVRASAGLPNPSAPSSLLDAGFAFDDRSDTGLFANMSAPDVGLYVDGEERLLVPGMGSIVVRDGLHVEGTLSASGDLQFSGDVLLLGSPAHEALRKNVTAGDSLLLINGQRDFAAGVMIGDQQLFVSRSSLDGTARVVVGQAAPAGTFRSAGSVRVATGLPTSSSSDVGLAFDEFSQTGLFAHHLAASAPAGSTQELSLFLLGHAALQVQSEVGGGGRLINVTSSMSVSGDMSVLGSDIVLGAQEQVALRYEPSSNFLLVDPLGAYQGGLAVGQGLLWSRSDAATGVAMTTLGVDRYAQLHVSGPLFSQPADPMVSHSATASPLGGFVFGSGAAPLGGLFLNASALELWLAGDNRSRVRIPGTESAEPVEVLRDVLISEGGNLLVSGKAVLGAGSLDLGFSLVDAQTALQVVPLPAATLVLNPNSNFEGGVRMGENLLFAQEDMQSGVVQAVVGNALPTVTLRSAGGVHVKRIPQPFVLSQDLPVEDTGYSFGEDPRTGMFAWEEGVTSDLGLFANGVARVHLSGESSYIGVLGSLSVSENATILGTTLGLGPHGDAALRVLSAESRLELNPDVAFDVVSAGNLSIVFHNPQVGTQVVLGVSPGVAHSVGESLAASLLIAAGGVHSLPTGAPLGPGQPVDTGYALGASGDSGLFLHQADPVSPFHLSLFLDGIPEVSLRQGLPVWVHQDLDVQGSLNVGGTLELSGNTLSMGTPSTPILQLETGPPSRLLLDPDAVFSTIVLGGGSLSPSLVYDQQAHKLTVGPSSGAVLGSIHSTGVVQVGYGLDTALNGLSFAEVDGSPGPGGVTGFFSEESGDFLRVQVAGEWTMTTDATETSILSESIQAHGNVTVRTGVLHLLHPQPAPQSDRATMRTSPDGTRLVIQSGATGITLEDGHLATYLDAGAQELRVMIGDAGTSLASVFHEVGTHADNATWVLGGPLTSTVLARIGSENGSQMSQSVRLVVGAVPPSGTVRSAGSVRAAAGLSSLDAGFAFDDHADTGLFAGASDGGSSSVPDLLVMRISGETLVSSTLGVQSNRSVSVHGELHVLGSQLSLGEEMNPTLWVNASSQTLHLASKLQNPQQSSYLGGLSILGGAISAQVRSDGGVALGNTSVSVVQVGTPQATAQFQGPSSLQVVGTVQTGSGWPTSASLPSASGFSFLESNSSGLFFQKNDTTSQLGLFVDGQLRISTGGEDSPTMVTNDLVIQGNVVAKNGFEISGDSLVLGTPPREVLGIASSVGLLGNGSVLFLNRLNEFPGGVVLGDHHFAVRRSSPTSVQATIGGVPPSGTLRSAGSVRSASGFPSLTSTSVNEVLDSGFAFDEHSQTGFFAENSALGFFSNGTLRLLLPAPSSSDPMYANASLSVEGELAVHGSSFHFGSSRGLAFSVQNESPVEVLGLNPTNSFAGGLVIGEGDMQISRPGVTPSLETLVQIGAGGNTSSRSLLRVSGQLGARSGYPDEIQSLDLRSGFSFHTLDEEDPSLLSTGLFSNLDALELSLFVDGAPLLSVSQEKSILQPPLLHVVGNITVSGGVFRMGFSGGGLDDRTVLALRPANDSPELSGAPSLHIHPNPLGPTVLADLVTLNGSHVQVGFDGSSESPPAKLQVFGGLQVAQGVPSLQAGLSFTPPFAASSLTGIFAHRNDSVSSPQQHILSVLLEDEEALQLSILDGATIFTPLHVIGHLSATGNASVGGSTLFLGPAVNGTGPSRRALSVMDATSWLVVNPQSEFSSGVQIADPSLATFRMPVESGARISLGPVPTFLRDEDSLSTSLGSLTSSTLQVGGGVQATVGLFALDSGFSFLPAFSSLDPDPPTLRQARALAASGLRLQAERNTSEWSLFLTGGNSLLPEALFTLPFPNPESGTNATLYSPATLSRNPLLLQASRLDFAQGTVLSTMETGNGSCSPASQHLSCSSETALWVDPGASFLSGVLVGPVGTMQLRYQDNTTWHNGPSLTVGNVTSSGTLRSSGSVRAASGILVDAGFAFDDHALTGLFATPGAGSGPPTDLSLLVNGDPLLHLSTDGSRVEGSLMVAGNLTLSGVLTFSDFVVQGNTFRLGADLRPTLERDGDLLILATDNSYLEGVQLGGDGVFRVHPRLGSGHLLGGQATVGNVSFSGTFRSAGSVRAARGAPDDLAPVSPLDSGFAFDTLSDWGLFLQSDAASLGLYLDGNPMFLVPQSGPAVLGTQGLHMAGDLHLQGGALSMAVDDRLALSVGGAGSTLQINGNQDFSEINISDGMMVFSESFGVLSSKNLQVLGAVTVSTGQHSSAGLHFGTSGSTVGLYYESTSAEIAPSLPGPGFVLDMEDGIKYVFPRNVNNQAIFPGNLYLGGLEFRVASKRTLTATTSSSGDGILVGAGYDYVETVRLHSTGTVQAPSGIPSSSSDIGFTFRNADDTGLFGGPNEVFLVADGTPSLRATPTHVEAFGDVTVHGTIALGVDNIRDALTATPTQSPTLLHVNPQGAFENGVLVGEDSLWISPSVTAASTDQQPTVLVGNNEQGGWLQSQGALSAASGAPATSLSSGPLTGFFFDQDPSSGLFSSFTGPLNDTRLEVMIAGIPVLELSSNSTAPVVVHNDLRILGSLLVDGGFELQTDILRVGNPSQRAVQKESGGAVNRLQLNPDNEFSDGVVVGTLNNLLVRPSPVLAGRTQMTVGSVAPEGTLVSGGSIRAVQGLPLSGTEDVTSDVGFSFVGNSGAFDLGLFSDPLTAALHLRLLGEDHLVLSPGQPTLLHQSAVVSGNVTLLQGALILETGAALRPQDALLLVNPEGDFEEVQIRGPHSMTGVRILLPQGGFNSSVPPLPQMVVGAVSPAGTFRSGGSVRAAHGWPVVGAVHDAGFSFSEDGQSGWFSQATSSTGNATSNDVTAFLRGIAKLSIQESHTVVHRNLVVQGGTVSVGNSSWSALDVRSTSNGSGGGPVESLLALNGDNDFVGGVSLGGHHLLHISGDGVLSGSMRFGANTSSVSVVVGPVSAAGTLRSSGGVRASRGLPPSVPSSTDLTDAGFAFDATLASSGMFLNDIGTELAFFVNGSRALSVGVGADGGALFADALHLGPLQLQGPVLGLLGDDNTLQLNSMDLYSGGVSVGNDHLVVRPRDPNDPGGGGQLLVGFSHGYAPSSSRLSVSGSTEVSTLLAVPPTTLAPGASPAGIVFRDMSSPVLQQDGETLAAVQVWRALSASSPSSMGIFLQPSPSESLTLRLLLDAAAPAQLLGGLSILQGNLSIEGSSLSLGADISPQSVLMVDGTTSALLLNPDTSLSTVQVHADLLRVVPRPDASSPIPQLLIGDEGTLPAGPGTVRVAGGIFALQGLPAALTGTSPASGYAFLDAESTGLFSAEGTGTLTWMVEGVSVFEASPQSQVATVSRELVVEAAVLRLGSGDGLIAMDMDGTLLNDDATLRLNYAGQFSGGVVVGGSFLQSLGSVLSGEGLSGGFSFSSDGETGMFLHSAALHLRVNGTSRLQVSTQAPGPVSVLGGLVVSEGLSVHGTVSMNVSELSLGLGLQKPVLRTSDDNDLLTVNPSNQFASGIVVGSNLLRVFGSASSPHVVVGAAPPAGSLRSSGGVRASSGLPALSHDDMGFSFDEHGHSGLFFDHALTGTNSSILDSSARLVLAINGSAVLESFSDGSALLWGSLRSMGAVRASAGLPNSTHFDVGFAFDEESNATGLFAAPNFEAMTLQVQGREMLSLHLEHGVKLHENLTVLGSALRLGSRQSESLVVSPNGDSLHVDPHGVFAQDGGVTLGGDEGLRVSYSSLPSSHVHVTVGAVNSAGTLRSAGSVRSAQGKPTPLTPSSDFDAGFAFDEDGTSGLFFSSLAGEEGLSLMVDGVPGLSLNASGIVFHSDVVSTGQAVQLQGVQALEVNPAEETVSLNTGFSAANGVVIGSSSTFSLRPNPLGAADPPLVTIGDVTPSGTLRVEGSVRCSKGSPASPGSNVGFAFEDESQSGLFMDSSSNALSLYLGGNERVRVSASSATFGVPLQSRLSLSLSSSDGSVINSALSFVSRGGLPTLRFDEGRKFFYYDIPGIMAIKRTSTIANGAWMAIGTSDESSVYATLVVAGSVRSKIGRPITPESDVGFAFEANYATGVFLSLAGDMELSIDGSPRVIIPESSSAPVTIQSSLSVGGSSLVLGGSATALAVGGGGGDTLELNPASSFANGVLFHGETLISATLTHLTTPVLVSSSGSGVLPAGLFRVDGSIRGKKGYPTVGGPDPAFGYSFDEDSGTGLFAVEGGAAGELFLMINREPLLSLYGDGRAMFSGPLEVLGSLSYNGSLAVPSSGLHIGENGSQLHISSSPRTVVRINGASSSVEPEDGTLSVSGSVHADIGIPQIPAVTGFSFRQSPDSGMFASSSENDTMLSFYVGGLERIKILEQGSFPVQMTSDVRVEGGLSTLGSLSVNGSLLVSSEAMVWKNSPADVRTLWSTVDENLLQVDPGRSWPQGVSISGGSLMVNQELVKVSPALLVLGHNVTAQRGIFQNGASVSLGTPSEASEGNTFSAGLSFGEDSRTGLFAAVSLDSLELHVTGHPILSARLNTTDLTGQLVVHGTLSLEEQANITTPQAPGFGRLVADTSQNLHFVDSTGHVTSLLASPSDARLKENIVPIPDALESLKRIRGVSFHWNEDAQRLGLSQRDGVVEDVGVIAQEVEQVFPALVHQEGVVDGQTGNQYKSVNYAKLTSVLLQAIKEQQDVIEHMEERLQRLEALLEQRPRH